MENFSGPIYKKQNFKTFQNIEFGTKPSEELEDTYCNEDSESKSTFITNFSLKKVENVIQADDFFKINFKDQGNSDDNLDHLFLKLKIPKLRDSYSIHLKDIVGVNNILTTAFLNIQIKDNLFYVDVMDESQNYLCLGDIRRAYAEEGAESFLSSIKSSSHLSGTVAMKIWDHLCALLRPGEVGLKDAAYIICKHCEIKTSENFSLKLWRIFSNTVSSRKKLPGSWYNKFGYEAENIPKRQKKHIKLLSTLTLGCVQKTFRATQMENHIALLKNCYAFVMDKDVVDEIDPSCSLSTVFQKLEKAMKEKVINEKIHMLFYKVVDVFFLPDIKDSTTFKDFKNRIIYLGISNNDLIKIY